MPTWDGVIRDEDYAPLAAYVRSLAAHSGGPRAVVVGAGLLLIARGVGLG
jgi:hypothetical protein